MRLLDLFTRKRSRSTEERILRRLGAICDGLDPDHRAPSVFRRAARLDLGIRRSAPFAA